MAVDYEHPRHRAHMPHERRVRKDPVVESVQEEVVEVKKEVPKKARKKVEKEGPPGSVKGEKPPKAMQ